MKRILTFCLLFILVLSVITACNDNPISVDKEPPALPTARSMQMDFSEFDQQANKQQSDQFASTNNFGRAVVTAAVMKVIVDLNLAIPRALLKAAENSDAEFNEDGEWEWSFTKTHGGKTFSVKLEAMREGENTVQWNFYITNSELGLENQLFFSGITTSDGNEGRWSYYSLQNTESQEQVSMIEWSVDGEDSKDLKLEVTSDRNDRLGDFITYSVDGNIKTATYFNAGKDETTELQINSETDVGYIIAPDYNNGSKACWDSNFQDVACD